MNQFSSRYLVADFINDRLRKHGMRWDNCPTLDLPPSQIQLKLRSLGDEFQERFQTQFDDMVNQLHITKATAYPTFQRVVQELFIDGNINWGRIVALFVFGASLSVKCVQRGMPQLVDSIVDWVSTYLCNNLEQWITDNGGWVSKRKCAHESAMEISSMMTEDKIPDTGVGDTRKRMDDGYKLKQCSSENTLKDIDALQHKLNQKDKQLQFIREENCLIRNLFNQQITSLLEEIKEKENIIQQLQKFDKFHDVKKENNLDGLAVKLDTVIGEITGMCSAINELLVEARRKSSLSDTKNITFNIRQKGILNISTEE